MITLSWPYFPLCVKSFFTILLMILYTTTIYHSPKHSMWCSFCSFVWSLWLTFWKKKKKFFVSVNVPNNHIFSNEVKIQSFASSYYIDKDSCGISWLTCVPVVGSTIKTYHWKLCHNGYPVFLLALTSITKGISLCDSIWFTISILKFYFSNVKWTYYFLRNEWRN